MLTVQNNPVQSIECAVEDHEIDHDHQYNPETVETVKTLDLATAQEFIKALTGSAHTKMNFRTILEQKDKSSAVENFKGTVADSQGRIERLNNQGAAIYFTVQHSDVNPTKNQGIKAQDIQTVRALFIDFDGFLPSEWHIQPSIISRNANNKGHAYWVLSEPVAMTAAEAASYLKRLVGHYNFKNPECIADFKCTDIARILRLPGSWHLKGEPTLVSLEHVGSERYSVDEVMAGIDADAGTRWEAVLEAKAKAEKAAKAEAAGTNTHNSKTSNTLSPPSPKNNGGFKRMLAKYATEVAEQQDGGRNDLLNKHAITLFGLFTDEPQVGLIRSALSDAAIACGLNLTDIAATLNSAEKAAIEKPIALYGSSESGKPQPRLYAQMLQENTMKHVEYCTVADTFMAYSEKAGLWEQVADKKGEAMVNRALSELGVFSLRFTMDVWAFIKLDAIAKESSFHPLGKDKIAFQNGVLDLKTMTLVPNSPDLKVTSRLEYCYPEVGSDFPVTRKFLADIACGDEELQGFFIHWLAATLRRMSGCRKFLNLYGHTTNGKSTYLKLIATMIGQSNVFSTSLSKLGGHFGASGADGKWAIQCTDDRGGYGIDYGNLLKFSGDDNNVPMVKKGKDQKGVVDFQGLVMLATNINLFAGQIGDAAIKTRMISVHCQASFTEDQQDEHLLDKMTAELPQLVHYLLNINPSEVTYGLRHSGDISVIKAHNLEQILDGEMVADFWDKVCVATTEGSTKLNGLLVYNAYCHYYSELHNGTKPNLSAKKFYPALVRYALTLSDVTLTKLPDSKRGMVYTNLSLVDFSHLGMNPMSRS